MKGYDTRQFVKDLESLNLHLTGIQIDQFLKYYELLIKTNRMVNLTAITDYDDVLKKHFVDSVSLVRAMDLSKGLHVIDIGTGAGFPGLALKLAFPELRVTLLDSLNKRIQFLNEVISELGLDGVETVHGRAEDFARPGKLRESFDLCVSRAVANLSTLAEYCLPYVKVGGFFVSYKSEKISKELAAAENAVALLGGSIERQVEFMLPNSDISRNFVLIRKNTETPGKYPRKAGLPGKEPL